MGALQEEASHGPATTSQSKLVLRRNESCLAETGNKSDAGKDTNVQRMCLGCGDVSACAARVSKSRCVRDVSGVSAPFIGVCPVFSCVSALFGTMCPRCVARVSGCVRMCPRRVGACPNVTRMRARPNASQNTARPGTSAVETPRQKKNLKNARSEPITLQNLIFDSREHGSYENTVF